MSNTVHFLSLIWNKFFQKCLSSVNSHNQMAPSQLSYNFYKQGNQTIRKKIRQALKITTHPNTKPPICIPGETYLCHDCLWKMCQLAGKSFLPWNLNRQFGEIGNPSCLGHDCLAVRFSCDVFVYSKSIL